MSIKGEKPATQQTAQVIDPKKPLPPPAPMSSPEPALKIFESLFNNYLREIQEAWSPEETQKGTEEAHRKYLQAISEASTSQDALKYYEAYLDFLRALQEAWMPQDTRRRYAEAYNRYLQGLKNAWAQITVNELDPNSLLSIGHSIVICASYAHNTLSQRGRSE